VKIFLLIRVINPCNLCVTSYTVLISISVHFRYAFVTTPEQQNRRR